MNSLKKPISLKKGVFVIRLSLVMGEYHACNSKNIYHGDLYLTSPGEKTCILENEYPRIKAKDLDVTNWSFANLIRGRFPSLLGKCLTSEFKEHCG